MRDLKGGYFVGYSHWLQPGRATLKKVESWTQIESVVEFMRFENVDDNPEPKDLRVRYSAWGDKALRVPHFKYPLLSIAQEPSIVRLPDKRLFCVMRTNSGYIWYSLSADDGETWCNPRPLLRKDHGLPILQPVGCCPIYQLADGRYVLLHHNNRGNIDAKPEATHSPRRPAFIALGEFRPGADQPIWFSDSKQFMDTRRPALRRHPARRREARQHRHRRLFELHHPEGQQRPLAPGPQVLPRGQKDHGRVPGGLDRAGWRSVKLQRRAFHWRMPSRPLFSNPAVSHPFPNFVAQHSVVATLHPGADLLASEAGDRLLHEGMPRFHGKTWGKARLPQRTSLVAQTAAILKERIQSGEWHKWLPGEHELCAHLRVARMTLRGALAQLEQAGMVRVHQGKRREILARRRLARRAEAGGCCY